MGFVQRGNVHCLGFLYQAGQRFDFSRLAQDKPPFRNIATERVQDRQPMGQEWEPQTGQWEQTPSPGYQCSSLLGRQTCPAPPAPECTSLRQFLSWGDPA